MTIATYSDLQSAIADYLARSDLTARIPDFISLVEARLNRVLRVRDMETSSSVTMSSGSGTVPADYLEWISAQWVGTRTADLRYAEPDSDEWRFRYRPNGDPTMFSILAGTIKLRPVVSGTVTLYYYKAIPALASNSTNWLLTRAADMYVNGALAEAYKFAKDEVRQPQFYALFEADAIKLINDADSNKVTRRPQRSAEMQARQLALEPQTGGNP